MPVYRQPCLSWLSLDTSTQLTHLCTMHTQLLDALGTLLRGLGDSLPKRKIHTHAHTLSCHIPMKMA